MIEGEYNDEEALLVWGDLILEYASLSGDMEVSESFEKSKDVLTMKNSYMVIKAMIKMLMLVTPDHPKHGEYAEAVLIDLRKMGYKIDTSNSDKYAESLNLANRRVNSIITQIRMKENEIKGDASESNIDFDQIISMLQLDFNNVDENMSVKRYISMREIIKKKYAKAEKDIE